MSRRIIATVGCSLVAVLVMAGVPASVWAKGGHGGGGHGGHGGGHHGGGHHGGFHFGGGRHYGGHHYGGYSYRSYSPAYRSYYNGNTFGNRGVTTAFRNNTVSHRYFGSGYRYRYPYSSSYFFGLNSPFGLFGWGGYGGYGNWGYVNNYAYNPTCSYSPYPVGNNGLANLASTAPPAIPDTATIPGDALQGEIDFKAGDYAAAENDWRHALLDDPKNGALTLLLAQAMFAGGKFDEAAGAVQHAMQMLPDDKWGVVVSHYTELYRGNQDYTDQLRKLEAARTATSSPGLQFLLGYHYGYLGYPQHAVGELSKCLKLAPQDDVAKKLMEIMEAKLPSSSAP